VRPATAAIVASVASILVFGETVAAAPAPSSQNADSDTECQISLDAVPAPAPRFDQFPARVERIANPAPVDLNSDPGAREFRTMLRRASRQGVDFAGHFKIATFGCGTSSICWGIVDERSGRVNFEEPHEIAFEHVGDQPKAAPGTTDLLGMRYRADSNLLILLGAPNEEESIEGVNYYRWTGARLVLVKHVAADRSCRNVRTPG
jgi:hypothetical protein